MLFILATVRLVFQVFLSVVDVFYIPIFLLFGIGLCYGAIFSTLVTLSLRNVNVAQKNLLISIIYACSAGGIFICSTVISSNSTPNESKRNQREISYLDYRGPEIIPMGVHSRYSPLIILAISSAFQVITHLFIFLTFSTFNLQASSLYPLFTLWKSQNAEDEVYNDIGKLHFSLM